MQVLSQMEIDQVGGGNAITFVRNAIVGGVIYDGVKSAVDGCA